MSAFSFQAPVPGQLCLCSWGDLSGLSVPRATWGLCYLLLFLFWSLPDDQGLYNQAGARGHLARKRVEA
jgi:hypothetical protein